MKKRRSERSRSLTAWRWPLGIAAILTGVAIWFYASADSWPIEFVGDRPNTHFYRAEDFTRKPLIDIRMPAIGHVVYPKKRAPYAPPVFHPGVCGYLETTENSPGLLTSDRQSLSLPIQVRSNSSETGGIFAIPYATSDAYRRAYLTFEGKTHAVRLPVTDRFGPPLRKTETLRLREWTAKFQPRPWIWTTLPYEFDLSIAGPNDRKAIGYFSWNHFDYGATLALQRPILANSSPILVEAGPGVLSGQYALTIEELKPVPFRCTVKLENGSTQIDFGDGELRGAAELDAFMKRNRWRIIEFDGRTFARDKPENWAWIPNVAALEPGVYHGTALVSDSVWTRPGTLPIPPLR